MSSARTARRSSLDRLIERIERRLAIGPLGEQRLASAAPRRRSSRADAASEVAAFALGISGKRRQARRSGRLSRLLLSFALAATLAVSACEPDSGTSSDQSISVSDLSVVAGGDGALTHSPRPTPASYDRLVLLGTSDRLAYLLPVDQLGPALSDPKAVPVIADSQGAGLDQVGATYRLPGQAVTVGSRGGYAQFLDPLAPADVDDSEGNRNVDAVRNAIVTRWQDDDRLKAVQRAMTGQLTVLDAAYNAYAASSAGGTHSYTGGVVLRLDPQNPVLEVTDRALLESGAPLKPEDVVYVAIRQADRALYDPGQVVNLRDIVVEQHDTTDDQGQKQTVYVANAALDGARVEPTGSVDLQGLLNRRLQTVDQDLSLQARELASDPGAATASPVAIASAAPAGPTPGATPQTVINQTIVQGGGGYHGPSLIEDFLIWRWLTSPGYYGGTHVTINNPAPSSSRPTGGYYYVAPSTLSTGPNTSGATTSTSRSQALQTARSAVSGQAAGTGGGTAATLKSAADSSARVSAATSKAASIAGQSSAASVGKSTSSVATHSGTTAARSSGSVTSSRSTTSGASSAKSSSSSGFGGKGISGAKGGSSSS